MTKSKSTSDVYTACFERDDYTCQDCGTTNNLEVHHILPISQGGKNELSNLRLVCKDCHKNNYKHVHYPKDKSKLTPYEEREKTRHGIDKNKYKQVVLSVSPDLLKKIEDYQFGNRISNRSGATRTLIEKGLKDPE